MINSNNYDKILVNIEKNVIIEEAESYVKRLALHGNIYLSGFYLSMKIILKKLNL